MLVLGKTLSAVLDSSSLVSTSQLTVCVNAANAHQEQVPSANQGTTHLTVQ